MTSELFRLVLLLGLASVPVAAASVALLARGGMSRIGIALAVGLLCAIPGYMVGVSYFCLAEAKLNALPHPSNPTCSAIE